MWRRSAFRVPSLMGMRLSRGLKIGAVQKGEGVVQVQWLDQERGRSRFHSAWLRDNCRCAVCVDPASGQKLLSRKELLHVLPSQVTAQGDGSRLDVLWNDGHTSSYPSEWLEKTCLSSSARQGRREQQQPLLWTAETLPSIPELRYEDVLTRDDALKQWLSHLQNEGVCLLTEAGKDEEAVVRAVKRVGPIRETIYGRTWRVETVPGAENIAYTNVPLELHSDILYYETPPGVQLLHCIHQAQSGAQNFFADAFQMAEDFKKDHTSFFQTLCRVPITYEKQHRDVFRRYRRPLFQVDEDGHLAGVYFSPQFEGTLDTEEALVRPFYEAYVQWHSHIRQSHYLKEIKLAEGQVITFNNRRILHGRQGFSSTERRLLIGTYFDLDELSNRLRVLQREKGDSDNLLKRIGNHSH